LYFFCGNAGGQPDNCLQKKSSGTPAGIGPNLRLMHYPLENALFQWEEGWRALGAIDDARERRRADRVVAAVGDELRRRIGPTFRAAELADLYGRGTDWTLQIAFEATPTSSIDPQSLADAAFWLYLRGATDFAGGRQLLV
jgi:hypothetical protein